MYECDKCAGLGLRFRRHYAPEDFFEGATDSRVWIVGLNPANDPDFCDPRHSDDLANYLVDPDSAHAYFRDFRAVSPTLYAMLGQPGGVGHTDLVKCYSRQWPPAGTTPTGRREIIRNCVSVLEGQLRARRPSMLICNGAEVCAVVQDLVPPPAGTPSDATSYVGRFDGDSITVVLSGFVGRIDNYARRRLGREVEALLPQGRDS